MQSTYKRFQDLRLVFKLMNRQHQRTKPIVHVSITLKPILRDQYSAVITILIYGGLITLFIVGYNKGKDFRL